MRKTLNKLFSFFVSLLLVISFTSCGNLFSGSNDDSDMPETKDGVKTIVFTGFLALDSNISSDFLGSKSLAAKAAFSRSAAPAPLNITDSSSDYEYYVTASSEKGDTVSAVINSENRTFEVGLQLGKWTIEAGVRTKGQDWQKVLTDSFEVELVAETPTFSHSFYLKPVSGGNGSINLEMEVTNDITKVEIEGSAFETKTINADNSKIIFAMPSITTGTYNLRFTFFKGDTSVYSTVQTINVLAGFATTKWFGGTSDLIQDGKFKITSTLTESWKNQRKEYYVSSTGKDTNTGGPLDPLLSLKHAVALVNDNHDGTSTIKIHIQDGISENISSPITVNAGKKVSVDAISETPSLNRDTTFTGSIIQVGSGAEVSLEGIKINGNNVEGAGCNGIENHGSLTLKNFEITGNKGTGLESAGNGRTKLAGGVIKITGNTKNLNLEKDDSDTVLPIQITGTLSEGSIIGISSAKNPTRGNKITITSGYSTYNSDISPTDFFRGDVYGIKLDDDESSISYGEVQLVPNLANIYNALNDLNMSFKISRRKFIPGTATDITITPKITRKTKIEGEIKDKDITNDAEEDIVWDIKLYLGSKTIDGWAFTTPTFTIPASASYDDVYTLIVYATYKGMTFNTDFVLNDRSPLVQVDSYTWSGSAEEVAALSPASNVFIAGRTLNIPALIVSDHEITQGEYEKYCKYNSDQPRADLGKGTYYPAYYVSWYDALVYCNLRSRAEGLTPVYKMGTETNPASWSGIVSGTGTEAGKYCGPTTSNDSWNSITFDQTANGWRLPTLAEWEYLARGGNIDSYTYSGSNDINEVAWYAENSGINGGNTNKTTHEVKGKKANSLGLYDMNGNVWEWCWDWKGTINSSTGYTGVSSGTKRTLGGGSWYSPASRDIVNHGDEFPYSTNDGIGFRVVRNAE